MVLQLQRSFNLQLTLQRHDLKLRVTRRIKSLCTRYLAT